MVPAWRSAAVATDDKYQLMHIEMFPYHIIHAECLGGDIDLLWMTQTTRSLWLVWALPKTRFGDGYAPEYVDNSQRLTERQ